MAFSLNKVMLIGNLGRDSETRFTTTSNIPVTSFSMATTYSRRDKEGNWTDETTWHNVVAFNLSEFYQGALKKGAKVYVEGRLQKREYTDKEGVKRYPVEVIVDQIIPLDSRGGGSSGSQDYSSSDEGSDNNISTEEDDLPF